MNNQILSLRINIATSTTKAGKVFYGYEIFERWGERGKTQLNEDCGYETIEACLKGIAHDLAHVKTAVTLEINPDDRSKKYCE